jgi:hypothetical protein
MYATIAQARRWTSAMSLCIHILFAGELPSEAALTQCFEHLGFPLAFDHEASLPTQGARYLPMLLRGEGVGVELGIRDGRQHVEDIAGEEVDPRLIRAASLQSCGGDEAGAAASCLAAAFAKLVDGLMLRSYWNADLTPDRAIEVARDELKATAERFKRPATGPADIRRYLDSLLQQRGDLVLIGRLLLVRPVRHLLRGVLLETSGDRFELRVGPYLMPLHDGSPDSSGPLGHLRREEYEVWRRNFVPLLIDDLAENLFGPLGRITTLADFAALRVRENSGQSGLLLTLDDFVAQRRREAHLAGDAPDLARITALVLAGEIDRAAALVEQHDRQAQEGAESPAREHFNRLIKDLSLTCAEYRVREAELVKAMKLEPIWEPAPFPVEVAASERNRVTAEPPFAVTPWPGRPPGMRQEGPTQPGEVRFAENYYWRGETLVLRAPLTREQVEDRHRAVEDYVLVVRLPDGRLLTVSHSSTFDRDDPDGPPRGRLDATYHIGLYAGAERVFADVSSTYLWQEHPDLTQIFSIERYRASERVWLGYFLLHEGRRSIHDWRSGEQLYASAPLTEAERELCTFRKPAFGDYATFLARIEAVLRLDDTVASLEGRSPKDESKPTPTEINVVFDGNLPGKDALAQMFDQLGFPLSFQESAPRLAQHDGYLPMRLRGKEVTVAFDDWDVRGIFKALMGAEATVRYGNSASFGWSNQDERAVALCLAAAFAKLKDGLVEGLRPDCRLTADEAIARAGELLEGTADSGN